MPWSLWRIRRRLQPKLQSVFIHGLFFDPILLFVAVLFFIVE